MDVKLPSGVVLKKVPDGLSDEDIKTGAIAQGIANETDFAKTSAISLNESRNEINAPLGVVDNNVDEVAAKHAVDVFLDDKYGPIEKKYAGYVLPNLYKSNDIKTIYNAIQKDASDGTFDGKMLNAKLAEFGLDVPEYKPLRAFIDNPFSDMAMFYAKTPFLGYAKAVNRLFVGGAEFVLPKKLEKILGVSRQREQLNMVQEDQQMDAFDELYRGDYGRFLAKTTGIVLGDTFGNLMFMKQGLDAAKGLLGGNLTLVQQDKLWRNVASNRGRVAGVIAGMTFLSTEGDFETRWKAAVLSFAYMNTPIFSSLAKTDTGARIYDIALNSIISGIYDPEEGFQVGGQYKGLVEESKQLAAQYGKPDEWRLVAIAKAIPIAGPDVVFGMLSKSMRANTRSEGRANISESAMILKPYSDSTFERLKQNMAGKYGADWIAGMDDVDRTVYENARVINANLEKGELPPTLKEIEKRFVPRVNPSEMGRVIQRENEGVPVWRDSEGRLVSEPSSAAQPPQTTPEQPQGYKTAQAGEAGRQPLTKEQETLNAQEAARQAQTTGQQAQELEQGAQAEIYIRDLVKAQEAGQDLKSIVLSGEDEILIESAFKTIFSQSKKARSIAFGEAAKEITDWRKLIMKLPRDRRGDMIASIKNIVEAKTEPTKESRRKELEAKIQEAINLAERQTLLDSITKKIPKGIAAEYAEAIQDLQDMILTDIGPKTKWRLEQQRIALENNPSIKLSRKAIQMLSATDEASLSISELRQIATEIDRLREQGKTLFKLRATQRKREVEDIASTIQSTAKTPKNTTTIVTSEKKKERFKGLRYLFYTGALRPWNLVDILDGGRGEYNGRAHEVFINEANDKYSNMLAMTDARMRGGEAFIRSGGLSARELGAKAAEINGKKISLDDLLSVYASSKNRLMHNAVLYGNFKGDVAAYDKAVKMVEDNPSWKGLADYIIYDYANNYNRLRKAVIRNENKILGNEENYIPMVREEVVREPTIEEISNTIMARGKEVGSLPGNKFTIDRKEIGDRFQQPVKLGLFSQWEHSVSRQERYINLFDQVMKMKSILANGDLKMQLKDAYGNDYYRALENYVEAYGNPLSIFPANPMQRISRKLRRSVSLGYLAYNVMTMGKQVPSIILYLGQGGGKNLLTAADDFLNSWRVENGKPVNDLIDFVNEKDPQIKHAHIERELDELKMNDKGLYERLTMKIGLPGMMGIAGLDKAVRTIGWYSTYLKSMEMGKTEQQAVRDARNATMRTQPAAAAKDLPDIYKAGEGFNWALMFSNQINQLWNLMSYNIPRQIRHDPAAVAGITAGLMANAIVMYVMNHKKLPENDQEFVQMLIEQSLGKMPVVGSTIVQSTQGYDSVNPIIGLLSDSVKAANKAAKENNEEAYAKALQEIMQNVGTASGIPITPMKRIYRFFEEGDPMELLGGKTKNKNEKKTYK